MLKLFDRAGGSQKEKRSSPLPVYAALLSIVLCVVCLAGTSWAWFTSNQTAGMEPITAARYGITVTVAGEGVSQVGQEENVRTYRLSPNGSYTVTLTPAEGNTASRGYCLVAVDGTVYYTSPINAEGSFTFTYGTGVAVPEGLDRAGFDRLVSQAGDTELTVAWYWGTYPHTQDADPGMDPGYVPLQNGAVLGVMPGEAPLDLQCSCLILCGEVNEGCPVCQSDILGCAGAPAEAPTEPAETAAPTETTEAPTEEPTEAPTEAPTEVPAEEPTDPQLDSIEQ